MKSIYYFDTTVKGYISDNINLFIVDSTLYKGKGVVGNATDTVINELQEHLKNLKTFTKYILGERNRFSFDTDSANFELIYDFFVYLFISDEESEFFGTRTNIHFLRAMQKICVDMLLAKGKGKTILDKVNKQIRQVEVEDA